jgi:hypothetical protein
VSVELLFPLKIRDVDNTENIAGQIKEKIGLDFIILGRKMKAVFYVTTLGKQVIILGLPWLESADPDIHWKNRMLRWRHPQDESISESSKSPLYEPTYHLAISYIKGAATKETQLQWVKSWMNKASLFAYNKDKAEMEEKQKKMLQEQVLRELHKYLSVFSDNEASRMPQHTEYDHKIELKHGFILKWSKVYGIDPINEEAFNKFLDENLAKGYIRKPLKDFPQASGFFFIPKKDGRMRPCQDYHYINEWTVKNVYPLPRIDDLVDNLSGMRLFTKMDICWGYNNVRINKGDEWKAAFISKRGIYEPTVMFFGLTNSLATFQNIMDTIFQAQIAEGWLKVYMDGLLIANDSDKADMMEKILIVLKLLKEHNLFLKPEKCSFYVTKVDFLGFIIKAGKILMDPAKLKGILEWLAPTTVTQL